MELIHLLVLTLLAFLLSQPSLPADFPGLIHTADFSVTQLSLRFRYYSAVRRLAQHHFPFRFRL
jgi:hypothetical protein